MIRERRRASARQPGRGEREEAMEYVMHATRTGEVAVVTSITGTLRGPQDFLELVANIPARAFVIPRNLLDERFFDLKTGVAGDILQKVSNYRLRLAILGDFEHVASKSLRDFISESNRGNQVIFVDNKEEALERWSR
jgi:hypothetical protein